MDPIARVGAQSEKNHNFSKRASTTWEKILVLLGNQTNKETTERALSIIKSYRGDLKEICDWLSGKTLDFSGITLISGKHCPICRTVLQEKECKNYKCISVQLKEIGISINSHSPFFFDL